MSFKDWFNRRKKPERQSPMGSDKSSEGSVELPTSERESFDDMVRRILADSPVQSTQGEDGHVANYLRNRWKPRPDPQLNSLKHDATKIFMELERLAREMQLQQDELFQQQIFSQRGEINATHCLAQGIDWQRTLKTLLDYAKTPEHREEGRRYITQIEAIDKNYRTIQLERTQNPDHGHDLGIDL